MSQERWFNKKTNQTVAYLGKRNKISKCNEQFVNICKLSQKALKNALIMFLYEVGYKEVHVGDGFVYVKGEIPYCLTAHLDTVHKELVNTVYEYQKDGDYLISSPQGIGGDDRCGVYMITQLLNKGYKPYVVFCEDEEIGCQGSEKFTKTSYIDELKECKYIIELDRANANDSVYYDCDNPEFEDFITKTIGYKTAWGSCSDISELCPACEVAGVNLSCGYYNAHTLGEYVSMNEMNRTTDAVEKLLNTKCEQFEYIERVYVSYSGSYGNWYDKYVDTYYTSNSKTESEQKVKTGKSQYEDVWCALEIETTDGQYYTTQGMSFEEAWVEFFFNYPEYCFNNVANYEEYWL